MSVTRPISYKLDRLILSLKMDKALTLKYVKSMHLLLNAVFERHKDAAGKTVLRPRWARIGTGLSLLALLGWVTLTTSVFGYLAHYKGVESVTWLDVAWPQRWHRIRLHMGEHYLKEARIALAQREFDRARRLYKAGVPRSPMNRAGRISLAQLYVAARQPDLAKTLLLDRLPVLGGDASYLRQVLQFLHEYHYYADLARVCDELLADRSFAHRSPLAYHAALVAFYRGNHERAEKLLADEKLGAAPEGALLLARIDAERDQTPSAQVRLENLLAEGQANDAIFAELARIMRITGQPHRLGPLATMHLASDPLSPTPRITLLYLHHERGDQASLDREIADFFTFFGHQPDALLALGDFAANTGRADLALRIEEISRARGWPLRGVALMRAEATIAAGRFAEGLELVRSYLRENPGWAESLGPVFDSLQAIALFSLNRSDEARLHLDRLLSRTNLRTGNLQAVATRLIALHLPAQARTVLTRAVALDPLNQTALTLLVRLEAEGRHVDTLPVHTRRLLQMRRPSPEALKMVYQLFRSDQHLLHPEQPSLLAELESHLDRRIAMRL
jgi:predicted Zn-dependent protease